MERRESSAAAFYGVNGISFASTSTGHALKSAFHGYVGSVMSVLQGGQFGHGFLSTSATQAAAGRISKLDYERQRVIAAAALSGTVSELTGGKFVNGAVTAAFGRAVSERQQRWWASQNPGFGGPVNISTQIAVPSLTVRVSPPAAVTDGPGRDLSPPPSVPPPATAPTGSQARIDFSATDGVGAWFDNQQGLEGFQIGGISGQQLRESHLVYAGTSLAIVPVAVGASAGTVAALSMSAAQAKIYALAMLEANASSVSFANQYLITNAARQIPGAYAKYISRVPGPRLPYSLVLPK